MCCGANNENDYFPRKAFTIRGMTTEGFGKNTFRREPVTLRNERTRPFIFRISRVFLLLTMSLLVTGVLAPRGYGQSGSGSIQGTVKDATGAAIPGAQVHVGTTGTRE